MRTQNRQSGQLIFLIWVNVLVIGFGYGSVTLSETFAGFFPGFHTWLKKPAGVLFQIPRDDPAIRVNQQQTDSFYGTVEVVGIDPHVLEQLKEAHLTLLRWRELFPIYTGSEIPSDGEKPSVLGTYEIGRNVIRFRPRFPLVKGLTYSSRFNIALLYSDLKVQPRRSQPFVETTFTLPKPDAVATTVVTQVYPSSHELPQNQLKFYIHFSAPMSRSQVYKYIHLTDASGNEISGSFLKLEPKLWDPNSQRLTLFFDPGRIKRGLRPHQDLGPAMQVGHTYRLVIDRDLQDADGNPLVTEFQKSFAVGPVDRTSPDYKNWSLHPPAAETLEPVILNFSEPLEHALLGRMLAVLDSFGNSLEGRIEISNQEIQWRFLPQKPWKSGDYVIQVDPALEDLAGNRLNRLFDVDTHNPQENRFENEKWVTLSFVVEDAIGK